RWADEGWHARRQRHGRGAQPARGRLESRLSQRSGGQGRAAPDRWRFAVQSGFARGWGAGPDRYLPRPQEEMMADQTLDALNEVHGQAKPDDVGIGEWIWGALQGDFNAERSTGQIGFDMVVSLIPVVDTVCDLRDLCANIRQYRADPSNKITLFFIATTVIGFFPELGTRSEERRVG